MKYLIAITCLLGAATAANAQTAGKGKEKEKHEMKGKSESGVHSKGHPEHPSNYRDTFNKRNKVKGGEAKEKNKTYGDNKGPGKREGVKPHSDKVKEKPKGKKEKEGEEKEEKDGKD